MRNTVCKSDTVRKMVAEGDFKNALRIASDFRLGISEQDRSCMKLGYECMNEDFAKFYKSIGIDTAKSIYRAIQTVSRLYG